LKNFMKACISDLTMIVNGDNYFGVKHI